MIQILKLSLAVVLASSALVASGSQIKMYDVKSGKIEYKIKGSGEIMGQKLQSIGKKRVIFDAYGAKKLTEENKIEKQTIMGEKKVTKTHTMTYMKEGMVYQVDFKAKRIMRMANMSSSMGALFGGQNMKQIGEEMIKKMGGKKTGTDSVLGYTCNVWELMGTKQCIYKGITLKVESNMMGIKNIEVATKVEFDMRLSTDDFTLPDFPIYNEYGEKLDRSKLAAMDKKAQVEAETTSEQMAELGSILATSAKNSGVKQGEQPTSQQEETMKNSMMEAMLPRMKQEMLVDEKMMRFGYECLSKANTLKEANICNSKANTMSGEEEEPFDEWSPSTKKEILGFLEQYLNVMIPCVNKAENMKAMRQCMPRE